MLQPFLEEVVEASSELVLLDSEVQVVVGVEDLEADLPSRVGGLSYVLLAPLAESHVGQLENHEVVGRRIHQVYFLLEELVELVRRYVDVEREVAREADLVSAIQAHEDILNAN